MIWPGPPDSEIKAEYVPLRILTDRELWERTRSRWEEENPVAWTAFVWRIAVPLSNQLDFTAAWR